MTLLEPSIAVTRSSKNDVYRCFSQTYYGSFHPDKLPRNMCWSLLPWSVLRDSSVSLHQVFLSVLEPINFKVREYLSRFDGDLLEVEKDIGIWIDCLDNEFGSKALVAITEEDELLIYWQKDNNLFNVLVDEDFEVEIIYIPSDRRKSQNRLLCDVRETTTETIKKAFDEMQRNN